MNCGQTVFYICNDALVGSHIPQVIARTKEYTYTINASGHGSAYGTARNSLGGGPSSVGSALTAADPAVH